MRQIARFTSLIAVLVPLATAPPSARSATPPAVQYLVDLSTVSGASSRADVEINGVVYERSLYFDNAAWWGGVLEYNLGRHYRWFEATAGVTDDSVTGTEVTFEVWGDGTRLYSKQLGLGEDDTVRIPIDHMLRLRLLIVSRDKDELIAWGSARLTKLDSPMPRCPPVPPSNP